uniref:Uncharacterized protein n=1 Tax=Pithovirus LCDPAC02 TaxID=2506601 RepID=A0A481YQR8_9VIRU|nr:MAG: hypothetical protein LCDPAC02_02940 [Pithovirus LCDPAC02]
MFDILSNEITKYTNESTNLELRILNKKFNLKVNKILSKTYLNILDIKNEKDKTFRDYVEKFCKISNFKSDSIYVKIQYMKKQIREMVKAKKYHYVKKSNNKNNVKDRMKIVAEMISHKCIIIEIWKELKKLNNSLNRNIYFFEEWCVCMNKEDSKENLLFYINEYYEDCWISILESEILIYGHKYIHNY